MDWALAASLIGVFTLISLFLVARVLLHELHDALENLDTKLAQAIQSLMETGLGEFDPPNPVQSAIAQFITHKLGESSGPIGNIIDVDKKS